MALYLLKYKIVFLLYNFCLSGPDISLYKTTSWVTYTNQHDSHYTALWRFLYDVM